MAEKYAEVGFFFFWLGYRIYGQFKEFISLYKYKDSSRDTTLITSPLALIDSPCQFIYFSFGPKASPFLPRLPRKRNAKPKVFA